jgi:two-component system NtrC family sensor kinase
LMAVLFGALFMIVRRADRIIAQQDAERQQTEQHLAQAEKMASLGQMVAAVAHQLNTPLAFSHNNVSMVMRALKNYELPLQVADHFVKLVKDVEADLVTVNLRHSRAAVSSIDASDMDLEMPTEMLKDTLQGIEQMREMVENLRDFTRLDRSKTAEFDLNTGLHNVAYIARNVISTRVQVVEEFAPLPLVRGNLSQLNQVFLNLLTNAAQAIPEDGTVTVKSGVEGNRIRVDVSDTGTGIPADVLPHIWENYFTTKPAGEGTGLGLAIAKSIVEEHGGEITVRTEPGKGTTFSVFLPALA